MKTIKLELPSGAARGAWDPARKKKKKNERKKQKREKEKERKEGKRERERKKERKRKRKGVRMESYKQCQTDISTI